MKYIRLIKRVILAIIYLIPVAGNGGDFLITADRLLPNNYLECRAFYPGFSGDTLAIRFEIASIGFEHSLWNSDTLYYLALIGSPSSMFVTIIQNSDTLHSETLTIREYLPPPVITKAFDGTERKPIIRWTFQHSSDLLELELQYSPDPFFTQAADSILTTDHYMIPPFLSSKIVYYYRLRTVHFPAMSNWTVTDSFLYQPQNHLPSIPVLTDPAAETAETPYLLQWLSSNDQDNDLSHYLLRTIDENNPIPSIQPVFGTELTVWDTLKFRNHGKYTFSVCAVDSLNAYSQWSQPKILTFYYSNQAPVITDNFLTDSLLTFSGSVIRFPKITDPDGDPVNRLILTLLSDSDSTIFTQPLYLTDRLNMAMLESYLESLPDNRQWRFSLYCTDAWNDTSTAVFSSRFYLNLKNDAPLRPVILNQINDTHIDSLPFRFSWTDATDPDPYTSYQSISYKIKISQDSAGFQIVHFDDSAPGQTCYDLNHPLKDNHTYFFSVMAVDEYMASSLWSKPLQFFLDTRNDPPSHFTIFPLNDTLLTQSEILMETASDINRRDSLLRYEFLIEHPDFHQTDTLIRYFAGNRLERLNLTPYFKNHRRHQLRITVSDHGGYKSEPYISKPFYFNSGTNHPPATPTRIEPFSGGELKKDGFLRWDTVKDSDDDTVFYQLEFSQTPVFDSLICTIKDFRQDHMSAMLLNEYLTDNKRYYWRVKANDRWLASSDYSVFGWFYYNSFPNPPRWTGIMTNIPSDHIISDSSFVLKWRGITDDDYSDSLNALSYQLQFASTAYFRKITSYNTTTNTFTLKTFPAGENRLTFLRIIAIDPSEQMSSWSDTLHFYVNYHDEPPANRPIILYPPDRSILYRFGQIAWRAAYDPDPKDIVTYTVNIYSDSLNSPILTTSVVRSLLPPRAPLFKRISLWKSEFKNQRDYQYNPHLIYLSPNTADTVVIQMNLLEEYSILQDNETYYWRVTASDKNRHTLRGNMGSFILNRENDPPSPPAMIVYPANQAILTDDQPTIAWKAGKDNDPDDPASRLRYELKIWNDQGFTYNIVTAPGITAMHIASPLTENGRFLLAVRTIDPQKFYSIWSDTIQFAVNAIPESPVIKNSYLSRIDTVFHTVEPLLPLGDVIFKDPVISNQHFFYDVKISFPAYADTRHYQFPVPQTEFSDSLPFYDNSFGEYQIRIISPDSINSEWSKIARFGVDLFPEPPDYFEIKEPKIGQDTLSTLPKFEWTQSKDPDLNDQVYYQLIISEDSTFFNDNMVIKPIYSTKYTLDYDFELYEDTKYFWRVAAVDRTGHTVWGSRSDFQKYWFVVGELPSENQPEEGHLDLKFYPLSPNPFSNIVTISYYLPQRVPVELSVYNLRGQKVTTLYYGTQVKGRHFVKWDTTDRLDKPIPAGIYIFTLRAANDQIRQKGMYIK